ncbi:MAG: Na/Pi cotransporter family protein [Flavobacteriales bacterium]
MQFGLVQFLLLAGSLGFFIHGMKVMSEGLQRVAGARMRRVLDTMTRDRFRGVFTGFITTVVTQYSSVTSVMVVSFTNAGLLTLRQSVPVLMGANIGTTVKILLFAWLGFSSVKLTLVAVGIVGIALPLLFMRGGRTKAFGDLLIGAALLFLGLDLLKEHMPMPSAQALSFLDGLSAYGIASDLLFVLIGAALAIVTQSSSVALVLTVLLAEKGIIQYETAAALVIGENIGTTLTANIAALVGNAWAKRAARAHFLIKLVGAAWALLLFQPLLHGIALLTEQVNHTSPFTDHGALKWSLTYLHIAFNVLNTALLINFIPWIERVTTRMVPSRSAPDEEYRLEYIEDPVMPLTPELSLLEARKEVVKFAQLCHRMMGMVRDLLVEKSAAERTVLLERIAKYEDITDRIEVEVSRFLTKTGSEAADERMSERIRAMISIIGDLERVGDIFFQMSKGLERKSDERLWFSPEQRQNLLEMLKLTDQAFQVMLRNLRAEDDAIALDEAIEVEQRINQQRDQLRRAHLKSVETGEGNVKSGLVYNDLFSSCEKVGDHLINVSEALVGMV